VTAVVAAAGALDDMGIATTPPVQAAINESRPGVNTGAAFPCPLDIPAYISAIDRVGLRDAGVTVAFDVVQESAETFLPLVGLAVPCPSGQVVESALAISLKGAFGAEVALRIDLMTELVAIDRVGHRDAGVTVGFDVARKSTEGLLPLVGARFPCPPFRS
jgi:hypothetical protein